MKPGNPTVTLASLQQMKVDGHKIVGVVAWDYQMAQIVDRAGVDLVSVGDTVGVNLWGHAHPLEVTLDEMVIVCKAVRRGVKRALLSCDFPYGPLQEGTATALRAAIRLVKEAGADMIKLDGAADFPEVVEALVRAGIPVFAQFGITPQTALRYGIAYSVAATPGAQVTPQMQARLLEEAKRWRARAPRCSTSLTRDPRQALAVAAAVRIPVIGGFGGGPGSMAGCDSPMARSDTLRARSMQRSKPMPMLPGLHSMRLPHMPATSAPRAR